MCMQPKGITALQMMLRQILKCPSQYAGARRAFLPRVSTCQSYDLELTQVEPALRTTLGQRRAFVL